MTPVIPPIVKPTTHETPITCNGNQPKPDFLSKTECNLRADR